MCGKQCKSRPCAAFLPRLKPHWRRECVRVLSSQQSPCYNHFAGTWLKKIKQTVERKARAGWMGWLPVPCGRKWYSPNLLSAHDVYCVKQFTSIISFNAHNNPMRWLLLSFPFHRWENTGSGSFPNGTQLVKSKAGICTQVGLTSKHVKPGHILPTEMDT